MKQSSFTDLFIRKPVVALVINFLIVIAGIQAWKSLSVRQYPRSENASVSINTVYIGANAELVRGFVTTPLERAIASRKSRRVGPTSKSSSAGRTWTTRQRKPLPAVACACLRARSTGPLRAR
jgi:multidrug efflux pump subunit AcrB